MYQIEGTFTVEDYLQALRLGRHGRLFIVRVVSYVIVGIMLVLLSLLIRTVGLSSPGISIAIIAIVIVILTALLIEFYLPMRARKIFKQQKELHQPFKMQFGEDGAHFENSLGQSTRPWNLFHKWRENENLFMLYYSDIMFTMLPKRLMNQETTDFIRNQLRDHNIPQK